MREAVPADAAALLLAVGGADLAWLDDPSLPPTLAGLEDLLADVARRRTQGVMACWAIAPAETTSPIGVIVVRGLDPGFSTVECSAVLAAEYRGTGMFADAARLVWNCLFGAMRVHRIEVRVDTANARAQGALRKLGASPEGVLRQAKVLHGVCRDVVLWSVLDTDWARTHTEHSDNVH